MKILYPDSISGYPDIRILYPDIRILYPKLVCFGCHFLENFPILLAEFVYDGKVDVSQDRLQSFLRFSVAKNQILLCVPVKNGDHKSER